MSNDYKTWKELKAEFVKYTRAERNGIIILASLCLIGAGYRLYDRYQFRNSEYDYTEVIAELEKALGNDTGQGLEKIKSKKIELFKFNPNTVNKEEMLRLGFKERAIATFMKYRNSGAKFRSEKDFAKVYSIDSTDIARVKDYMFFTPPTKSSFKPKNSAPKKKFQAPTLFDFDPNLAKANDLKKLGLSEKVIRTLLNFRKKGSFRKASDLAKIYGLSEAKYQALLPYIKIEQPEKTFRKQVAIVDSGVVKTYSPEYKKARYPTDEVAKKSIDINRATEEEWQRIDGIGPAYAQMINKFRSKLGGFYAVSQIGDTYGIPDSVYQKILPFVKVSEPLTRIQINLIKSDSLARHPYLSYKEAKVITNYRAQHGPYTGPKDVFKVKIFSKEEWERIVPYLDYETAVDTFNHDEY